MKLLFDCNFLCYRAKHATPDLSWDGEPTDILFSFLNQVLTIANKFKTDDVVFCWDSRKSFRKHVYKLYKAKRLKTRQEKSKEEKQYDNMCYTQYTKLRKEILPELGFKNSFMYTGLEADDLLGYLALRAKEETLIVARDNDLLQLLNGFVSIYDPISKNTMTQSKFKKKWGVEPYMWGVVKTLSGCSTDNVEGIQGVGETTAIKFLKGNLKPESVIYKRIKEELNQEIIECNKELVMLPHPSMKHVHLEPYTLKKKDFIRIFNSYGFNSFLKPETWIKWVKLFNLQ